MADPRRRVPDLGVDPPAGGSVITRELRSEEGARRPNQMGERWLQEPSWPTAGLGKRDASRGQEMKRPGESYPYTASEST